MSVNLFDVVLLVVLVGFTLLGLVRGALKEGLSLLGLAIGYWAALSFHEDAGEALTPIVQDSDLGEVLAFVLILGAGYLGGTFLAGATDNMATRAGGPLAGVLAAVFGFAKGLLVAMSLIWLVNGYIAAFQDQLAGSTVAAYLEQALGWVSDIAL